MYSLEDESRAIRGRVYAVIRRLISLPTSQNAHQIKSRIIGIPREVRKPPLTHHYAICAGNATMLLTPSILLGGCNGVPLEQYNFHKALARL